MGRINWEGSPSISLSQSQTTLSVNISGMLRVMSMYASSHNWTVWLTFNGNKISTIPITPDGTICYVSPIGGSASFSVGIPSNYLGSTVTVSFFAQDNSWEQDSTSDPPPSQSFSFAAPSVTWSGGTSLSATTDGVNITATLNGSASVGGGFYGTVYYRIWCDSTRKNIDGSTARTWTFEPTAFDVQLTISVEAYATIGGVTYTTSSRVTCTITVDSGAYVDYYDGTQWVQCKIFYYDGTDWIECRPYYYDGTDWVEISS